MTSRGGHPDAEQGSATRHKAVWAFGLTAGSDPPQASPAPLQSKRRHRRLKTILTILIPADSSVRKRRPIRERERSGGGAVHRYRAPWLKIKRQRGGAARSWTRTAPQPLPRAAGGRFAAGAWGAADPAPSFLRRFPAVPPRVSWVPPRCHAQHPFSVLPSGDARAEGLEARLGGGVSLVLFRQVLRPRHLGKGAGGAKRAVAVFCGRASWQQAQKDNRGAGLLLEAPGRWASIERRGGLGKRQRSGRAHFFHVAVGARRGGGVDVAAVAVLAVDQHGGRRHRQSHVQAVAAPREDQRL